MESSGFENVPEQGQLVEVRQRRYVVGDIVKSSLPPTTLPGGLESAQHLVSLTSVEDDALGEELQVIWELEPGARTYDPLVRAIQMLRVNLLIADDVGLGKTIESGLVTQELLIRHRARRNQLQAIMVRRLKSELPPHWDGTPQFVKFIFYFLAIFYDFALNCTKFTLIKVCAAAA